MVRLSITTYAELKTAIDAWMHANSGLDTYIPDFVTATESMIAYGLDLPNRKINPLRVLDMTTRATASVSAQYVDWPSDALGIRNIQINGTETRNLDFLLPEEMDKRYLGTTSGEPKAYSIIGRQLQFGPIPDTTYTCEIAYYKKYAAFSADADNNWVLTNHPFIYLYGSLAFAHTYIYNQDQADQFFGMYASLVEGLNGSEKDGRYSGSSLRVVPR